MSRISELEFYNDKDVITQIEWLKNNIKADHIESVQVVQNTEKGTDEYGLTTIKITMENGHEYKGEVVSAIIKDVRIQSGEDFNVMVFELANGETISCNIPLGSDSYWAKIKGEPQSNTALKAWMDEKAEAVDLTNETNLRVRSDEAIGQRITDLDRDVSEEIERIDGELTGKADKSALDEEITKRTEADTGLLQAISDEETARQSADETLETAITGKADQSALETEIAARTDSDTGLLQAITAEETARKSADDGIYGRITELNKDLDDETTAREEEGALKEDKANKVTAWSSTTSDDKYPSEKLVYNGLIAVENVLTKFVNEAEVDYKVLSEGVGLSRVIIPDGFHNATALYVLTVDKYLEDYTYQNFPINVDRTHYQYAIVPSDQVGLHFKSYNGVSCELVRSSLGTGWLVKREDNENLGTDRFSFTFAFLVELKKRVD